MNNSKLTFRVDFEYVSRNYENIILGEYKVYLTLKNAKTRFWAFYCQNMILSVVIKKPLLISRSSQTIYHVFL